MATFSDSFDKNKKPSSDLQGCEAHTDAAASSGFRAKSTTDGAADDLFFWSTQKVKRERSFVSGAEDIFKGSM